MATDETLAMAFSSSSSLNGEGAYHFDGDDELDSSPHLFMSELDDEDEDGSHELNSAISNLSLDDGDDGDEDDVDVGVRRISEPVWIRGAYDSETEPRRADGRRKERSSRERFLNRAWEMRRCSSGDTRRRGPGSTEGDLECRLMVRPRGREEGIPMDMQEVKACRDLGLNLPRDWTVEISCGGDTSSGGSSPISDWRISSPGDSPRDIKARLKVWAQAVALASTSRLSS